uniref:Uncharacterized protein n=1 Tax=uncultured bacterium contig00054 TaxID=1181538 RepID=A0A806K1P9_9BACT|nr:hypothetical protein [uncultured bacterium contig00054]
MVRVPVMTPQTGPKDRVIAIVIIVSKNSGMPVIAVRKLKNMFRQAAAILSKIMNIDFLTMTDYTKNVTIWLWRE